MVSMGMIYCTWPLIASTCTCFSMLYPNHHLPACLPTMHLSILLMDILLYEDFLDIRSWAALESTKWCPIWQTEQQVSHVRTAMRNSQSQKGTRVIRHTRPHLTECESNVREVRVEVQERILDATQTYNSWQSGGILYKWPRHTCDV